MTIKVEELTAKKIINFYPPVKLYDGNGVVVVDKTHHYADGCISKFMNIDGVERCLISDVLLSVKYENNANDVRLLVLAELSDILSQQKICSFSVKEELSKREVAEAVADAFIRPFLNRDNGDLDIIFIADNTLTVKFTGHCSGCPYAQNTLQNVIIKTFKRYMPQIQTVTLQE